MLNNETAKVFVIRNANLQFKSQPQSTVKNCHRLRTKTHSMTMVCSDIGIMPPENIMKHDI